MWFFIFILLALNLFHTLLNLSLFNKKSNIFIFCIVIGIIQLLFFPYSVRLNIKQINFILNDYNTLSFLCIWQIIEAIIFMLFCLLIIREHYNEKIVYAVKIIPLFPSLIFLSGVFLLETYLLNTITKIDFLYIAIIFSISFSVLIFLSSLLIRKILSNWELRMEIKIILSFFQIVFAMFLPLLLMGMQVQGTQLNINVKTTVLSYIGLFLIFLLGIFRKKYLKCNTQFWVKKCETEIYGLD